MLPEPNQIQQPLHGRNIVITRALAQAEDFAIELERFGARVIPCPTIEIVEPESYAPLDEAIDHLFGYDWIVFTSVNGVEYFLRRLHDRARDISELDELQVCAIGEATAERLTAARLHTGVITDE